MNRTSSWGLKKIKDLCSSFPKVSTPQNPLDTIAGEIFKPYTDTPYVQSIKPPSTRYGIPVDKSLLGHTNKWVKNFNEYGPNEQYLINKFFFSPSYLLYIVGGIGVGKTRFAIFFIEDILPQAQLPGNIDRKPCVVYYDFLEEGKNIKRNSDSETIETILADSLSDHIEACISRFLSLEDEVTEAWDFIIEKYGNSLRKPRAVSFILAQTRLQEATKEDLAVDYDAVVDKRKKIRRRIEEDRTLLSSYVALLLRYLKERYFSDNPVGVLIVIDNVDRESSLVQQTVKKWLKTFARTCKCRVVVNARQTTYYQQFDDGISDPIDVVPYCGPLPIDVVLSRVDFFVDHYENFSQFGYSVEFLSSLAQNLKTIKTSYLTRTPFIQLIGSLCGHSVRKGLLLAQHIVNNSVYNPAGDIKSIGIGDVLRALIVGTDDTFRASAKNIVDNIFEVSDYSGESFLVKSRILLFLNNSENGRSINQLLDVLYGFQYSLSLIRRAINELKQLDKRLIWSDAVRLDFSSEQELVHYGNTRLYITTAGKGYIEDLLFNIDYIQEVMLDTKVEADRFGEGWDYGSLEDRFTLVFEFLSMLSDIDEKEVGWYIERRGAKNYARAYNDIGFITKTILKKVQDRVSKILSAIERTRWSESFRYFMDEHLAQYDDRIIRLENLERRYFS